MRKESLFRVEMFAFALVFSFISNIIPYFAVYRFPLYYLLATASSRVLINPVLLFVVSYIVGKKVVLRFGLLSAVVPLFLGTLVGSTVLYYYFFLPYITHYYMALDEVIAAALSNITNILQTFFISFTAMTIGVLRNSK